MSSSTTRARWSLGRRGAGPPRPGRCARYGPAAGSGGIGKGAAPPRLGQPRLEATSSTVEGRFRSPTSRRGARPGGADVLQLPQLADVVALFVGQMGRRDRERARPQPDRAQQRGALLTPPAGGNRLLDATPVPCGASRQTVRPWREGQRALLQLGACGYRRVAVPCQGELTGPNCWGRAGPPPGNSQPAADGRDGPGAARRPRPAASTWSAVRSGKPLLPLGCSVGDGRTARGCSWTEDDDRSGSG
jgi:hypothetical protein